MASMMIVTRSAVLSICVLTLVALEHVASDNKQNNDEENASVTFPAQHLWVELEEIAEGNMHHFELHMKSRFLPYLMKLAQEDIKDIHAQMKLRLVAKYANLCSYQTTFFQLMNEQLRNFKVDARAVAAGSKFAHAIGNLARRYFENRAIRLTLPTRTKTSDEITSLASELRAQNRLNESGVDLEELIIVIGKLSLEGHKYLKESGRVLADEMRDFLAHYPPTEYSHTHFSYRTEAELKNHFDETIGDLELNMSEQMYVLRSKIGLHVLIYRYIHQTESASTNNATKSILFFNRTILAEIDAFILSETDMFRPSLYKLNLTDGKFHPKKEISSEERRQIFRHIERGALYLRTQIMSLEQLAFTIYEEDMFSSVQKVEGTRFESPLRNVIRDSIIFEASFVYEEINFRSQLLMFLDSKLSNLRQSILTVPPLEWPADLPFGDLETLKEMLDLMIAFINFRIKEVRRATSTHRSNDLRRIIIESTKFQASKKGLRDFKKEVQNLIDRKPRQSLNTFSAKRMLDELIKKMRKIPSKMSFFVALDDDHLTRTLDLILGNDPFLTIPMSRLTQIYILSIFYGMKSE